MIENENSIHDPSCAGNDHPCPSVSVEPVRIAHPVERRDEKMPDVLERSEVPRYFRQFRNASILKKLAHARKGPPYQLIGRKAWYDTADIRAWLDGRKGAGPQHASGQPLPCAPPATPPEQKKRRGRPTKAEQHRREFARQADMFSEARTLAQRR